MVALPGTALLKLIIVGDDPPGDHLRLDDLPVPGGAQTTRWPEGAFDLGRFELPVAIAALIWVVVALFVLVMPGEALVPDLIVLGLMLAGGLFEVGLMIFTPQALASEPDSGQVSFAAPG